MLRGVLQVGCVRVCFRVGRLASMEQVEGVDWEGELELELELGSELELEKKWTVELVQGPVNHSVLFNCRIEEARRRAREVRCL